METIVLLLPLTILSHFAFGKAKAATWEIKGTIRNKYMVKIFKLVAVEQK